MFLYAKNLALHFTFISIFGTSLILTGCNNKKGGSATSGATSTQSTLQASETKENGKPAPTITVTASPVPAPTVTVTSTPLPGATVTATVTATPLVTATVTATPSPAPTVTATVTATPSPVVEALSATVSHANITVGQTSQIVARGGVLPLNYSIVSGAGSVNSSSGLYFANGTHGPVSIRIKDAANAEIFVNIQVSAELVLIPNKTYVAINGTVSLITDGGIGTVTITKLSGGGSYNHLTQTYTAPASSDPTITIPDIIVLQAMDSVGNTAERALLVYNTFAPTLDRSVVSPGRIATVNFVGGLSPFTLSANLGSVSGSGTSRTYTAPSLVQIPPQSSAPLSGTGLQAYYKFNEASISGTANVFLDSSGNDLKLNRSNTNVNLVTDGDVKALSIPASGNASRASVQTGSGPFSIQLWVKSNNTDASYLFSQGTTSTGAMIYGYVSGTNLQICGYSVSCVVANNALAAQSWNQVVITYAATSLKVYVNGVLAASGTRSYNLGNGLLNIGSYNNGAGDFLGLIDEVMFFNREISATEVSSLYRTQTSATLTAADSVGNQVQLPITLADRIRLKMADDTHFGSQANISIAINGGVGPYQLVTNAGTSNLSTNAANGASGVFTAHATTSSQITIKDSQGGEYVYSTSTGTMVISPTSVVMSPNSSAYFYVSGTNSGILFYSTTCPRTTFLNGLLTFLGGIESQWCSATISDSAGNYSSASVLLNVPQPYYENSAYYFAENTSGNQINYTCPSGNCSHSSNDSNCSINDPVNNANIEVSVPGGSGSCEITIIDNAYGTNAAATVYWSPRPYFSSDSYSTDANSGFWADYTCPSGNCSFGTSGNCSYSYSSGSQALFYAGSGNDSCTIQITDNSYNGASGTATLSWSEGIPIPTINNGSDVYMDENSQQYVDYSCPSGNWSCSVSSNNSGCDVSPDYSNSRVLITTSSASGSVGSCGVTISDNSYGSSSGITVYYEGSPYFNMNQVIAIPGSVESVAYTCPGGGCTFSEDTNQCGILDSGGTIQVSPFGSPSSCQPRITSSSGRRSATMVVIYHEPPPPSPTLNNGQDLYSLEGQTVTMNYTCPSGNCGFYVGSGNCSAVTNDTGALTVSFMVNLGAGDLGSCSLSISDNNYGTNASITLNYKGAPRFENASYAGTSGSTITVRYYCPSGSCNVHLDDSSASVDSGPDLVSDSLYTFELRLPMVPGAATGSFTATLNDTSVSPTVSVSVPVSYNPPDIE